MRWPACMMHEIRCGLDRDTIQYQHLHQTLQQTQSLDSDSAYHNSLSSQNVLPMLWIWECLFRENKNPTWALTVSNNQLCASAIYPEFETSQRTSPTRSEEWAHTGADPRLNVLAFQTCRHTASNIQNRSLKGSAVSSGEVKSFTLSLRRAYMV